MLRVSGPKRRRFAWLHCVFLGLSGSRRDVDALMPFIKKHSKNGEADWAWRKKTDMSKSVSKDRENLLRATIALVGGTVEWLPNTKRDQQYQNIQILCLVSGVYRNYRLFWAHKNLSILPR